MRFLGFARAALNSCKESIAIMRIEDVHTHLSGRDIVLRSGQQGSSMRTADKGTG